MLLKAMQVLTMFKFYILLTLNYNLKGTESAFKNELEILLSKLRGFKLVTTLVLVFKTKFDNFYSSSKAEKMINESDIDDAFQSIYTTIITNIQKSLGKRSDWIIDSVIDHTISVSKYNALAGSRKLPKELDHPRIFKKLMIMNILNCI